ncbi:cryptococcal mannosyltransferase 1-domain-containing protein [Mycena filopes]|nr:cryptococcal mannosyltransferase 1-domain-containing protein [Mycena filopes]
MLDFTAGRASRWAHWPYTTLRTTLRLALHHIHLSLPLASFCLTLGLARLIPWLILGRPSGPGFPSSRALFIAALMATPIWAFSMCLFYLLWPFGASLWTRWRRVRGGYTPLVIFDADDSELVSRRPSSPEWKTAPRLTVGNILLLIAWLGYLALAVGGLYLFSTYELELDHRFKPAVQLANRVQRRSGYGTGEKIFIATMFHNNAAVIPHWTTEMAKVINYLGAENVFVSIVESYSDDDSAELLRGFEKTLEGMGVPHRILTDETSIPRRITDETDMNRIEFLAAVRNLALEPLVANGGYDRLLFSNDVFIQAESVVELLHTQNGDYDMACGMDFVERGLYDLWVLRDRLGRLASSLWPYFLEDAGFRAVMADAPAPVFACWNGIASMRAEPFLPPHLRSGHLSTAPRAQPLPPTHPLAVSPLLRSANATPAAAPALRFRASAPGECFSSEAFNAAYDLRRVFALQDIFVNPRVVTAYRWKHYVWAKYVLRHWAVKWFIEQVERGDGVHLAKVVLGDPAEIWVWDGGECHPGPW